MSDRAYCVLLAGILAGVGFLGILLAAATRPDRAAVQARYESMSPSQKLHPLNQAAMIRHGLAP